MDGDTGPTETTPRISVANNRAKGGGGSSAGAKGRRVFVKTQTKFPDLALDLRVILPRPYSLELQQSKIQPCNIAFIDGKEG